ncbi:MAG TPA: hypothetical protein VK543_13305 [Puia sp.]|nr:hypothetical protein [Puia sp.]
MKVYVRISDFYELLRGSDDPVYLRAKDIDIDQKEIILEMSYAQYKELLCNESPGCFQVDCNENEGKYIVNFVNRVWEEAKS